LQVDGAVRRAAAGASHSLFDTLGSALQGTERDDIFAADVLMSLERARELMAGRYG